MRVLLLLQEVTQNAQPGAALPGPGGPPRPEHGFSVVDALFQLIQFVGWFLSIGAIGFRFGVVRRVHGISDDARRILAADNAAMLGVLGITLLFVSYLGAPLIESMSTNKAFVEVLPKNRGQFEFRMGMLAVAVVWGLFVGGDAATGWALA